MNTRVAWVLLFTYVVQLVLGGFGIWVSVQISGKDVGPPSPPTTTTAPLTTLPPSRRWNSYENSQDRPSEEYRDYTETTRHYANYDENPTLYLIIPCGVAVMIAAVLIVGGICSRKTFSTTTGLYSSLGLWIVIFLITMQYQSVEWKPDDNFLSTLGWVIGMQVGLLLLLASQIALAVWELRRQKTGWPCINPTHLFTVEMILLITRVTLGVYVINYLSYSEMINGLNEHNSSWETPWVRFPEYYVLPCIIAALYGVIVSSEGILSQLFGKMHNRLMCCTTLISAICYAALAVVASPVFVRAVIGPYRMRQRVMIFASISSIVNFLHAIACLAFPSGVRAPPPYIRTIANHLLPLEFSSSDFNVKEALSSSSAAMSSAALTLKSKFRRSNTLCCNIISSTLSLLVIILVSIGAGGYRDPNWSGIMMLCVDVAVFSRSMPEAVTELVYHHFQDTNLLKSLHLNLENLFLFTASIGAFVTWSPAVQVVSGIINLLIVIVQTIRVMHYFSGQNKGITTDGEETKPLKEAELETAQELSDDEHSGSPESLA